MDMTRRNVGVIIAVLIVGSNVVETTDLLKAADDWSRDITPQGFTSPITTQQLLTLADE